LDADSALSYAFSVDLFLFTCTPVNAHKMGCHSSKAALLHVDDSVRVGLNRAKKAAGESYQGYVPPASHPSIRMKSQTSSGGEDTSSKDTSKESAESQINNGRDLCPEQ
jgi:hypothetical protein